ncbi:hypothetical protein BGX31_007411 [Mortierella sp. GBA43]|nr:hypothetical protein BGX31_007411 [Mortierella sp. GBA43]
MDPSSVEQPMQALRCKAMDEIMNVPARMDPKAGHYIVLWRDIQRVFENAKFVRNGTSLVPFMTEENFEEIVPQRIEYHPRVVLEVVLGGNSATDLTDSTEVVPPCEGSTYHDNTSGTTDVSLHTQGDGTLVITDTGAGDQPLVKYHERSSDGTQSSLGVYNQLYSSYFRAIVSAQETQTSDIKESIDEHFNRLQVDMTKNVAHQEQLVQVQQQLLQMQLQSREELLAKLHQMEQVQEQTRRDLVEKQQESFDLQKQLEDTQELIVQLQQSSKDELLVKQDEMLDLQKQTLNRLVVIMSRIQALLIQTRELLEYPVPRLFIVLPKATRVRDKLTGLFSDQFRLYFLCECGAHTMTEGCKIPHEIHLAKHEGYDLEKPREFFEKYGTYLLAMLFMIKYGVKVAGIVVPPLSNFKIVDGLETAVKNIDYLKKDIAPLVDDTIKFLQEVKSSSSNEMEAELTSEDAGFEDLEALEGADLRRLVSYLQVKDKGRVLGNLYRIVTPEGHVKWVCFDHYRTNYRGSSVKQLQDVVNVSNGTYIEQTGRIEIELTSSLQARQFYDVMTKARGIQELDIILMWDATMDELRELCDAITRANVIRLTVNGAQLKGPAVDLVYRGRRFDPILQLAANARIQSLQLVGFDDFFSRVTKFSLPAPKLREFSIELKVPLDDKTVKFLTGFLEFCAGLTTLEFKVHHLRPIPKAIMDAVAAIDKFESLKVDYGAFSITKEVRQGEKEAPDAALTIPELGNLTSDDLTFIHQHPVTRLSIETTPRGESRDMLGGFLGQLQGLRHFEIISKEESAAANKKKMMGLDELLKTIVPALPSSKLESLLIDYGRLVLTGKFSSGADLDLVIKFEQLDKLTSKDLQFLREGPFTQLTIECERQDDEGRLVGMLSRHPGLCHIHIRRQGEGHLAFATTTKMNLKDLVNVAITLSPRKPDSFSIHRGTLYLTGSYSHGRMQNLALTVERLGGVSADVFEFMDQDHPARLAIKHGLEQEDEDPMIDILRRCQSLSHVQIGCRAERILAMVELVTSTRRSILREGGSLSLSTVELMKEGLEPFDMLGEYDSHKTFIQSRLLFSDRSNSFDMRSWVRLRSGDRLTDKEPIYSFIRQYGWSIVFFGEDLPKNMRFAAIMDDTTGTRGSQLEHLRFNTNAFGTSGFDRLEKMMQRSANFKSLGLYVQLEKEKDLETVQSLFEQYGRMVSDLQVHRTDALARCFPQMVSFFPARSWFRSLESFGLRLYAHDQQQAFDFASSWVHWIVAMVSGSSHGGGSSETEESWGGLRKIVLRGLYLKPREWTAVVGAIDFSQLEYLDLGLCNMDQEQVRFLANRILECYNGMFRRRLPLRTLVVKSAQGDDAGRRDRGRAPSLLAKLQEDVPSVKIVEE